MNRKLLKISLVGTVISALCCFTPVLVGTLGVLGLSATIAWLDDILLPTLTFFIGLTVYALISKQKTSR